jgi:hypothetical protein
MLQALIGAEQGFFSSILSIGPVGRSARDEYAGALFIVHLLTIHIALVIFLGSPEDDQGLGKS